MVLAFVGDSTMTRTFRLTMAQVVSFFLILGEPGLEEHKNPPQSRQTILQTKGRLFFEWTR